MYNVFLGTKTRQKKFICGLRKTPMPNPNKPKKSLNLEGIVQSTTKTPKSVLPTVTTNNNKTSLSSLVSADYESSSD